MVLPRTALAAWLLLPPAAGAQELRLHTGGACHFDSLVVRDTIDFTLFLTPPRSVAKARDQREQYAPYISAVASTFEQPRRLSISYWPGSWADDEIESVGDCDAWCSVGPLEGEVQFRLHHGRVTAVTWPLVPDSPEVMRAVEQAVRAADSLRLFPPTPKLGGLPEGNVRLALRLARWPPAIGGVELARVPLPHVHITQPVSIVFQPTPHFPGAPAGFGLSGAVSLQFIVGEDGRVPEESVRVLEAEEAAFIPSAVRAIVMSQFRPAQAGACPVRQRVHQRVVFRR